MGWVELHATVVDYGVLCIVTVVVVSWAGALVVVDRLDWAIGYGLFLYALSWGWYLWDVLALAGGCFTSWTLCYKVLWWRLCSCVARQDSLSLVESETGVAVV